jgi:hypothetical protein
MTTTTVTTQSELDAPPMFIVVRFDVHGLAEARVTTGIAQAAA